ncbi:MAG: hypothetical protein LBB94_02960 [Clostridiales bacterium]|nr:hypothetical protein [Clostridiales bacterium]
MKKLLSICVAIIILVGMFPSVVGAESRTSKQLYAAPAIEGTIEGAVATQSDYLSQEAFVAELNQRYLASTRDATISNFEKTSDNGEWFKEFNSLTEEQQKSIDCRPPHFAEVQKAIYGKDTLWGFRIDMEWYAWFHSLALEEQRKVDVRPEKFAQVQEEVFGINEFDGGEYTEVKEDLPLKFYRVDTDIPVDNPVRFHENTDVSEPSVVIELTGTSEDTVTIVTLNEQI